MQFNLPMKLDKSLNKQTTDKIGSNNVSILLGTGTGSFGTPATNFAVGTLPQSVAVGDFN
jgi:hypothetical protein